MENKMSHDSIKGKERLNHSSDSEGSECDTLSDFKGEDSPHNESKSSHDKESSKDEGESSHDKESSKKTHQGKFQLVSFSRTVECKDGKKIETKKGFKCEDDKWFSLNSDGSWDPSSKEEAFKTSHVSTHLLEDSKSKEGESPCKKLEKETKHKKRKCGEEYRDESCKEEEKREKCPMCNKYYDDDKSLLQLALLMSMMNPHPMRRPLPLLFSPFELLYLE